MYALAITSITHSLIGNYEAVNLQLDELVAVAEEKSALFWKAVGKLLQGRVSAQTGKPSDAVHQTTSGIAASNQWEQHIICRMRYHIWRKPMRSFANSMTRCAALARG